ncbi:lytic polysaccharide monooxygenase [Hyaloscypha bicolor E]|uniref:AA9 family lytic polysaccharide monooxygenase n=1 Tax=Hyaloscypha bicolor E TaxID=1095630 RepID=A0A2J6T430_9HELO|nr:lytic polysaccharide monooxygenase [Hyaloscypha bicolor E]PMD57766.1 lytic polysaccharide monooxygenase [Hyaloscypha bicolor E]
MSNTTVTDVGSTAFRCNGRPGVADAATPDGPAGRSKIFQDAWSFKTGGRVGDDDNWGTKDLNTCCGKTNVKIPSDIAAEDYLLRAEALALYTARKANGTQFYMTCYQITVTRGGAASPSLVKFPGAYSAADPGIKIKIHAALSSYVVPGPPVYSGVTTKSAALEPKHNPQVLSAHHQLRKQVQVIGGDTCNGICITLLNFEREVKVLI